MELPDKLKKHWMTLNEALTELGGITRSTLHRRRQMGLIETRRFNGRVIVSRKSVEKYLANLPRC